MGEALLAHGRNLAFKLEAAGGLVVVGDGVPVVAEIADDMFFAVAVAASPHIELTVYIDTLE